MLEQILSTGNLNRAWKRVKANKGAAGIDGKTIEVLPAFIAKHWAEIRQQLLDGTYRPSPVLRVEIPKRSAVSVR